MNQISGPAPGARSPAPPPNGPMGRQHKRRVIIAATGPEFQVYFARRPKRESAGLRSQPAATVAGGEARCPATPAPPDRHRTSARLIVGTGKNAGQKVRDTSRPRFMRRNQGKTRWAQPAQSVNMVAGQSFPAPQFDPGPRSSKLARRASKRPIGHNFQEHFPVGI